MAKLVELTIITALFPLQVAVPEALKLLTAGGEFTVTTTEAVA